MQDAVVNHAGACDEDRHHAVPIHARELDLVHDQAL